MEKISKRRIKRYFRKNKKSLISVASVIFVSIVIILFSTVSNNYKIPEVYLTTDYNGSAKALTGGYEWRYGFKHVLTDALQPIQMEYGVDNILITEKETAIEINTRLKEDSKSYPFSIVSLTEYSANGDKKDLDVNTFKTQNNNLYITAPSTNGEYIYDMQLKFKRGEVNYGFKVNVTDNGSRTKLLFVNRTYTLDDKLKVGAIIDALTLPENVTGLTPAGFDVKTKPFTNDIVIRYNTNIAIAEFYKNLDNRTYFKKNAIIIFSLIETASAIKFNISNGTESYDIHYTREEAAFYMKKDIKEFARSEDKFTAMFNELNSSIIVTTYYLQAEMKGLELYVWKNNKQTKNDDTYFTLLIGTNRAKKASEIYDLAVAVKDIKVLNSMLARYSGKTYLAVLQTNTTDFSKGEMAAIVDKIQYPAANFSTSIGLWEKADVVAIKGTFPIENHNHFFTFDGKAFTPETDFMFMRDGVSDLDKSTYYDIEAFCAYARSLSRLTESQIQKILAFDKTITVGEKQYISLLDLRKLGLVVTVGWEFSYGTPVSFNTAV